MALWKISVKNSGNVACKNKRQRLEKGMFVETSTVSTIIPLGQSREALLLWLSTLRVAIMKASCCHYESFVLQSSRLCAPNNKRGLAKQVTVTRVTMWLLSWSMCWNYVTNEECLVETRTLDSPNWEFAVAKLIVGTILTLVFISSKSELCNCLYIR